MTMVGLLLAFNVVQAWMKPLYKRFLFFHIRLRSKKQNGGTTIPFRKLLMRPLSFIQQIRNQGSLTATKKEASEKYGLRFMDLRMSIMAFASRLTAIAITVILLVYQYQEARCPKREAP